MENRDQQTFGIDCVDNSITTTAFSESQLPVDHAMSSTSSSPTKDSTSSLHTFQRGFSLAAVCIPSDQSDMVCSQKTIFHTFSVQDSHVMQGASVKNDTLRFSQLESESGVDAFYQALLDKDVVALLVCIQHKGVDVNVVFNEEVSNLQPEHRGLRALHVAAQRAKDTLPLVQCLVDLGADVQLRSRAGDTPLHIAAKHASVSVIKFLLHLCPDLKDCTNKQQLTALMKAIFKYEFAWRGRYRETVQLLLEAGCNPNICPISGISPLHLAVQKHDSVLVKMLVDHGADVNTVCRQGTSPLLQALLCKQVHEDSVRILVAAKADVNICTMTGLSALHLAVSKCDRECVEDFLQAGADPNAPDTKFVTPLWRAVEDNNMQLVPLLVQYGGNINCVVPPHQVCLLSRAIQEQSVGMTDLLLQLGATAHTETVMGETPLHFAVDRPGDASIPIIKLLLAANCELDTLSNAKNPLQPVSPVQVAFENGNAEVVMLLIRGGCRVPLSWMYQHNNLPVVKTKPDLLSWIVKYMAQVPSLTHLTRLMLRRYLGPNLLGTVQELRKNYIPGKLADLLLLKDLTQKLKPL